MLEYLLTLKRNQEWYSK